MFVSHLMSIISNSVCTFTWTPQSNHFTIHQLKHCQFWFTCNKIRIGNKSKKILAVNF